MGGNGPRRATSQAVPDRTADAVPANNSEDVVDKAWLKSFQPFSGLEKVALDALVAAMQSRNVQEGDVILSPGGPVKELIVIRSGTASYFEAKSAAEGAFSPTTNPSSTNCSTQH